ncbi:YbbR-like domain-containing protein [Leptospira langatensis]|uniref:YbbR-like domain-containing protein n=1 Tax=Leptospira langatensis TaxID=2484983 RepID=A0A5F1ZN87_9LEPT|nr:YbbR-like domain-containing protein [Leptospira langatensis]TGK05231.1 YbbR-like domain-containing protein [Leptospira langatensis]TGL38367.1 YbbR-like domain-containing protein [Leptospira langatensis]
MFKLLLNNWQAKLGSVLLATLFYINLQNSKILVRETNIKIEYPKLTGGMSVAKGSDTTFPVKVEGVRDYVNFYTPSLKAYVNPAELHPGENMVSITRIGGIPAGLRVTRLKEKVKIIVESNVSRVLVLEPKFHGDPPKDYIKSSHFVSPASLVVVGNHSEFDKLGRMNYLPQISLADKTKTFTQKFKVPDLPAGLRYRDNIKEVSVTVNIVADSSTPGESIVLGVPVRCDNLDKNLEAEFSEQEVSVKLKSKTPLRSIQIIKGLSARVVCANKYDPKTKKILPDNKPVMTKVRLEKDLKTLKSVEIQGIFPDRISIFYRIRPDLNQTGDGTEDGSDGSSDPNSEEPLPEPEEE